VPVISEKRDGDRNEKDIFFNNRKAISDAAYYALFIDGVDNNSDWRVCC
jgi:hypothetical protein